MILDYIYEALLLCSYCGFVFVKYLIFWSVHNLMKYCCYECFVNCLLWCNYVLVPWHDKLERRRETPNLRVEEPMICYFWVWISLIWLLKSFNHFIIQHLFSGVQNILPRNPPAMKETPNILINLYKPIEWVHIYLLWI